MARRRVVPPAASGEAAAAVKPKTSVETKESQFSHSARLLHGCNVFARARIARGSSTRAAGAALASPRLAASRRHRHHLSSSTVTKEDFLCEDFLFLHNIRRVV